MTDKILIVDDDEDLRGLLEYSLADCGYKVLTACNGQEGMRLFEEWHPDLVILDVMMPMMNGWEACRQIRRLSNVPIIMLTAKAKDEEVIYGLDKGADEYVTKPFSVDVLLARVEAILRRAKRERASAQADVEELKQNIVSCTTHELRTPVAVILSSLELVLRDAFQGDPQGQQLFIARAQKSAQNLRWLIDDLLFLVEMNDTGALDITRRPLSVQNELELLLADTQPMQKERELTVRCECPEGLMVNASQQRFRHALHHLLDNALKFSPIGGTVEIKASATADSSAGKDGLIIAFRDQGPGIDPALHERIFERFYQVDSSIARAYGGLGIGLTIARAIARAHGGDVTVESTPGQGSTFRLILPAAPADLDI